MHYKYPTIYPSLKTSHSTLTLSPYESDMGVTMNKTTTKEDPMTRVFFTRQGFLLLKLELPTF